MVFHSLLDIANDWHEALKNVCLFYFNLFSLWTCKNLEHFLPNSLDMKVNGALTRSITAAVTKTTEETPNKQLAVEWRKLELIGITLQ